jgi:MFS family permease
VHCTPAAAAAAAVSRLATLMQHAVLAARTIVTAQSPEDERAALLGYIGASYGLGFAAGPAAGGLLSSVSLQATAWAAAAGSLLALGIVAVWLPAGEAVGSSKSCSAVGISAVSSPAAHSAAETISGSCCWHCRVSYKVPS